MFLGSNCISWNEEATYYSLVQCISLVSRYGCCYSEITWITSLIHDINIRLNTPPTLFYDNLQFVIVNKKSCVSCSDQTHRIRFIILIEQKWPMGQLSQTMSLLQISLPTFSPRLFKNIHLLEPGLVSKIAPTLP